MNDKLNVKAPGYSGDRQPSPESAIKRTFRPRLLTKLNQSLAELCGWLLIVVVLFMVVDLVARGFSRPLYGVSELAMFTMIAVVYLGLSHAEERDAHIRVEFLTDKLSGTAARLLTSFITLVSLVTVIIVAWAVWVNAIGAWERRQAIAGRSRSLCLLGFRSFFYLGYPHGFHASRRRRCRSITYASRAWRSLGHQFPAGRFHWDRHASDSF